MKLKLKLCAVAVALSVGAGQALAAVCGTDDVTNSGGTVTNLTAGGTTTINTAVFTTTDSQATGSGVIDSFVRISTNDNCVNGYNTDTRPLSFDENSSGTFTHNLLLSAVPIVTIGTTEYREFLLDINQTGSDPLITLNDLQIFMGTATASGGTVDAATGLLTGIGQTMVYDLDSKGNVAVDLNYKLNAGSGSGDLFVYIPNSLFTGATTTTLVTLYSSFGVPNNNNDGYEEWAVRTATPVSPCPDPTDPSCFNVPEPATVALVGMGLMAFGLARRRRML
jgi:hypothetical protein